jgi:hypothetical protein
VVAGGICLRPRNSVDHDGGLFISGPAIVKMLEDNRPIRRRLRFCIMRTRVLLPQAQVAEDALTDLPMAGVRITAFLPEKSAIKNFRIAKAYHQQTVLTLKVRELLSCEILRHNYYRLHPTVFFVVKWRAQSAMRELLVDLPIL